MTRFYLLTGLLLLAGCSQAPQELTFTNITNEPPPYEWQFKQSPAPQEISFRAGSWEKCLEWSEDNPKVIHFFPGRKGCDSVLQIHSQFSGSLLGTGNQMPDHYKGVNFLCDFYESSPL